MILTGRQVETGVYFRLPTCGRQCPEEELRKENYTGIVIAEDGRRYQDVPLEGYLLGKGARNARGKPETVEARCIAHKNPIPGVGARCKTRTDVKTINSRKLPHMATCGCQRHS